MPIPLIMAIAGAALSDVQQRQQLERSKQAARTANMRSIQQRQLDSTFGPSQNPYPSMQANLEGQLDAADREMRAKSNNHIGEILAGYFNQPDTTPKGDVPKEGLIGGGTTDSLLDPWATGGGGGSGAGPVSGSGSGSAGLAAVDDLFGDESINLLGNW